MLRYPEHFENAKGKAREMRDRMEDLATFDEEADE